MKQATLFITKAKALRAATRVLQNSFWTAAEPVFRLQRDCDTRNVEGGYVVRLVGHDGSIGYL